MQTLFESATRVTLIAAAIALVLDHANQSGVRAARCMGWRRPGDDPATGLGGMGTEGLLSGPAT
jgi:hypothetical protein